jgi:hypothetical protein
MGSISIVSPCLIPWSSIGVLSSSGLPLNSNRWSFGGIPVLSCICFLMSFGLSSGVTASLTFFPSGVLIEISIGLSFKVSLFLILSVVRKRFPSKCQPLLILWNASFLLHPVLDIIDGITWVGGQGICLAIRMYIPTTASWPSPSQISDFFLKAGSIHLSLPSRITSFPFCGQDPQMQFLLSMIRMAFGKQLRLHVRAHFGKFLKCIYHCTLIHQD